MFPQIAKRKKKEIQISDRVYKEWEEVSRELDHKAKLALKKIPNPILHDFSKVCRIKSIPEFYANYFIVHSYRNPESQLNQIFSEEIESLLTHGSHFHKISQRIKAREEILNSLRDSLVIVEGFMLMNQGKNVPLTTKGTIQEIVKGCQSLQQLKELQKKKTEQLANRIIQLRGNSIEIINQVESWRKYLEGLSKGEATVVKKLRVIYPHQAANCLVLLLYDNSFIKSSILKSQITFGKDQDDPFLQKISKNKKGGQIQSFLNEFLKQDTFFYSDYVQKLKEEIPSDQAQELREKELQKQREQQRQKVYRQKQQKEREDKIKAIRQQRERKEKQRKERDENSKAIKQDEKQRKMRVQRYSSVRNLKNKVEEEAERSIRNKTSRGPRSQTKIINIDALLQQRSRHLNKKQDLRIIGVYQKGKKPEKPSFHENSTLSHKDEDLKYHKKIWQKQIKEEQQEKQKIKRMLKQAEKKALVQTKQFQEKLKRYEEQVTNLRSRIDSAKKGKRAVASSERNKRISVRGKESIVSVYGSSIKQIPKGSEVGLLESKLQEQSRIKRNLQSQIKQLGKEKMKLQRQLQKQSNRISKESSVFQKKLEKYEQVINKLKGQSENNKKIIRQLQHSKISEQKKESQNLRMYTIKQKEEELKKKILQKIETKEQKKQLKESRLQLSRQKKEKSRLEKSHSKSLNDSLQKDLQIVKTKQTIEIVFEAGRRRKQPQAKDSTNRDLIEAEHKLAKLEKERELLEKKLEMTSAGKEDKRKVFESKIAENQNRVDRFKEQLQKERERNSKLQENIRQMRKSINNEFEIRLNRQRVRFEKQKEELLRTLERQKEEKNSRDRVLQQQMKFLKEMEKKETELISLLEREKREKKLKQQMLLQEIENKEQLKNQMEIEEIKRAIEREVRRELLQSQSQDGEQVEFRERKAKMEQQIESLKVERDNEISELDHQNERLKELITRIKGEEKELLEAIRENIDLESQQDQQSSFRNMTDSAVFRETKRQQPQPPNNDKLVEQLRNKTMLQYRSEQKKRQHYSDIQNSSPYKQKEKIENIVQLYLKSPHQYPGEKSVDLPQEEKKHIKEELQAKAKMIQQFQDELFSVKDLPEYVPSLRNDAINNHLLNLRDAYQDYQADALRRQLFPPLQEQVYNEKELSVESEQPPIVTLMDDVRAHEKKHSPSRKEDKKNFLSINRMRLMLLQQNRKQKQRSIIEQESRKKIQRQLFDKNRKKRQDKIQRKKQRDEEEKVKKREQLQKSIHERNSRLKERKQPIERTSRSKSRSDSKSSASEISKESIHKKEKTVLSKSKKARSERGLSESQTERDKQIHSDSERQLRPLNSKGQKLQSEKERKSQVEAIKEEQIQQSMDQKQEQQAQKMERALLKSEIKSLQSEVRSYISGEQQFQVYQQFINEDELVTYIEQLLQLSSLELKNLNGNNSLKQDVQGYCTTTILVAKNRKGIQLGVGIFHKEYEHGQYVCDYILSHKMSDFLNLIFNFSRFIYSADKTANKVQFIFDLKYIEDQETLLHFLQFQKKCRRLGEVYVKTKNSKERKYVLKRALFQEFEETESTETKGVEMRLRLLLFDSLMKEINQGFTNSDNLTYTSLNLILAYYLSQNPEELNYFRSKAENELTYRQLLVTALLFHKKELAIKNITQSYLNKRETRNELSKIVKQMDITEVQNIEEMKMVLTEKLPTTIKRGILEVGMEQIKYLIYKPEEAVTRVQSSNSSETGLFLSFIPKYKMMIIEAEEFLTMSQSNPDLTAFFYIKHFIKNIVDVKKEVYERVYLPQMAEQGTNLFNDVGQRLGGSVILEQTMKIGWKQTIGNSVIFTPKHRDLVIQKPFIVAILSGTVERAVEGSPLCVRIVQ